MKGCFWRGTVTHNSYSGTNSKGLWRMPLSYPEAFELLVELHRSSHRRCPKTKGVLIIFGKFTAKHLSQKLFFNKVAGLRPVTLWIGRQWYRCFPMNFAKLLRTPILKNICERLPLVAGWRTTYKLNRRVCYFYLVLFTLKSL